MTDDATPLAQEVRRISTELVRLGTPFALVGGLAVSIRGEVRLTRDVDVAVGVESDARMEALVRELTPRGYDVAALVEHEDRGRLATVRLLAQPAGIHVDLLAASSGIEVEIVAAAIPVPIEEIGTIPVATAEDLLAQKILSVSERRPRIASTLGN